VRKGAKLIVGDILSQMGDRKTAMAVKDIIRNRSHRFGLKALRHIIGNAGVGGCTHRWKRNRSDIFALPVDAAKKKKKRVGTM